MNSIDKLSEIFARFPGIGPRQAKRFVYYLLSRNSADIDSLVSAIAQLKSEIAQCSECMRYFVYPEQLASSGVESGRRVKVCSTCSDTARDSSLLCVVPRDIDFESIEKSGIYKGYYFVLGGQVPVLEKEPDKKVRSYKLEVRVRKGIKEGLKEIILAMNANTEGENTADYLKTKLAGFELTTSILGRGLSTGAELEYADPETLKNAFLHRTK